MATAVCYIFVIILTAGCVYESLRTWLELQSKSHWKVKASAPWRNEDVSISFKLAGVAAAISFLLIPVVVQLPGLPEGAGEYLNFLAVAVFVASLIHTITRWDLLHQKKVSED